MMISLSGVLERAIERLSRCRPAHQSAWGLAQLHKHLEYLRAEHAAGRGEAALTAFFAVWVEG